MEQNNPNLPLPNVFGDKLSSDAPKADEKAREDLKREEDFLFQQKVKNDRLETQKKRIQLKRLNAELKSYQTDIDLRKKFSWAIFIFLSIWIAAILTFVLFIGFGEYTCFVLSDSVSITLLGSTTVSVIGIFMVVAKYFFPQRTFPKDANE